MSKTLIIILLAAAIGFGGGWIVKTKTIPKPEPVPVTTQELPPIKPDTVWILKTVTLPYDTAQIMADLRDLLQSSDDCMEALLKVSRPFEGTEISEGLTFVTDNGGDTVKIELPMNMVEAEAYPLGRSVVIKNLTTGNPVATWSKKPIVAYVPPLVRGLYWKIGMYSAYHRGFLEMDQKVYEVALGGTLEMGNVLVNIQPFGVALYPINRTDIEQNGDVYYISERTRNKAVYGWSVDVIVYFAGI